uniref:Uncharacterized protein n=1 Tax=Setaria italica TaxID=4555 RepID=K3Z238_SETIT
MPTLKVMRCSASLFSPKRTALHCLVRTYQHSRFLATTMKSSLRHQQV